MYYVLPLQLYCIVLYILFMERYCKAGVQIWNKAGNKQTPMQDQLLN